MSTLELDLECGICHYIYLEPTVVTCGHMFCGFCIERWSKQRKQCPLCRKRIFSAIRIVNGEAIMNNMADLLLSTQAQEERRAAKRERQEALEAATIPAKRKKPIHINRVPGHRHAAGNNNRPGNNRSSGSNSVSNPPADRDPSLGGQPPQHLN